MKEVWKSIKKNSLIAFDASQSIAMIYDVTGSKNILAAKVRQGVK